MRAFILAISLTCLGTTGATAAPWTGAPAAGARCADDLAHLARPGKGAESRKLTDLPPADTYLAVFRRGADGCIVPVKVNDRTGPPRRR